MAISVCIENIGDITFTKSQKAKYHRITIRPDKSITVTISKYGSLNDAKQFLLSKSVWIKRQLRKLEQYANLHDMTDLQVDIEKAQEDLFNRLELFSKKYNFTYNRAVFRCQKTKWGSCSADNNINLNVNIVFLPVELQDYILLHELVHTKVKNHGKLFWEELHKYTNNRARELAKELRKYRMKFRH
jgi:predicted metal-dependent hydrolase